MALPPEYDEALSAGTEALGLALDGEARRKLAAYVERLLAWNVKVNLTAITAPAAVAELHLVDSLALLRTLGPARTLLDLGSGAGLPGIALACARPDLAVTCCDTVFKKVAFVKTVAAELELAVTGKAVRALGDPEAEGLPRCEAVVSRALTDPARWLPLGERYVAEGGKLFAMLGRGADEGILREIAIRNGLLLEELDRFTLPRSGATRAIARFRRG
ncbi:MAG TPA: 16S rRNA (guanine(527)-N(7))-methyltransferase RsmG [Anaeromyxobacteraceae bacterium]|nr:16S rRNA (guanine(527)-N(7))-methyltransferase RsmG [Anaeromyxobacteraceae bacterium]